MKKDDILPFVQALYACRKSKGLTQTTAGEALGISRTTFMHLEGCRWLPQPRERPHFIKRLHELDPALAKKFTDLVGTSIAESLAVGGTSLPLEAKHAKLVLDSAILGVAEQLDMSPRALRPIVAVLLERLAAAGMPMGQAATIAKTAPRPSP
jgi:transcriptional regulator with XRE-family HTH domain